MTPSLLDNPLVLSMLFYPRPDRPGHSALPQVHDGAIPVADEIVLGYRLYAHQPDSPLILYFHGNGEIASDHDGIAEAYRHIGVSLLVVDYRGYGWSTGRPLLSALLSDAEAVLPALPAVLAGAGLEPEPPLFVMGRSLGSAPAIHLAHTRPGRFKGLIVESGFAHVLMLLARLGLPADLLSNIPDPIGNLRKVERLDLPLLVIHGEQDSLIPVAHGQALYDASPAAHKRLLRIPGAGHNDLLFVGMQQYFDAVRTFIDEVVTGAGAQG